LKINSLQQNTWTPLHLKTKTKQFTLGSVAKLPMAIDSAAEYQWKLTPQQNINGH
jgi:hypothetical protein